MTAFLLVVPWLAVRHIVPALAGGDGAARAAHVAFGEGDGAARVAYGLLTAAAVLLPLALAVRAEGALLWAGAVLYAGGLALEAKAAGHRLVLAEERWCLARFGEPYATYMGRVRRYL